MTNQMRWFVLRSSSLASWVYAARMRWAGRRYFDSAVAAVLTVVVLQAHLSGLNAGDNRAASALTCDDRPHVFARLDGLSRRGDARYDDPFTLLSFVYAPAHLPRFTRPMSLQQVKFPNDWPKPCPPEAAEPADAVVYRNVKKNPVNPKDLRTTQEANPTRTDGDPCQRCGISVYTKFEDAQHHRKLFRGLGKFIAKGQLQAAHGALAPTRGVQPSHHTWWPAINVNRVSIFALVDEAPVV